MVNAITYFNEKLSKFPSFEDRKFMHFLKVRSRSLLPSRFLSEEARERLQKSEDKEIARALEEAEREGISLFGKQILPATGLPRPVAWRELFKLIQEVVIQHQYADELLTDDSIVFDVGANVGVFSIVAARKAKMVYAFEPGTGAYISMKKNVSFYPNVVPVKSAVGDYVGTNLLVNRGDSVSNVLADSKMRFEKDGDSESVEVTTIDEFVERNGIERVDFIKADTEGYERQVLLGAKNTIARWKPIICVSAYHLPSDREELPKVVQGIHPSYSKKLLKRAELDYLFT